MTILRWFQLAAIALIAVLVVSLYRAKTEAEAARARVAGLERQNAAIEANVRALRAEVAVLENPARIESLAARELGLTRARAGLAQPETAMNVRLPAPDRNP